MDADADSLLSDREARNQLIPGWEGISELIIQLSDEFQLWYDNNAWLAPKLVILSHLKLFFVYQKHSHLDQAKRLGVVSWFFILWPEWQIGSLVVKVRNKSADSRSLPTWYSYAQAINLTLWAIKHPVPPNSKNTIIMKRSCIYLLLYASILPAPSFHLGLCNHTTRSNTPISSPRPWEGG